MKECTYCGKEYPDNATVCDLDANPLVANGANAALSPKAKMTGLDKLYAKSSSITPYDFNNRLLCSIVGVFACKHPTARKNARIYFFRLVGCALAAIIALLIKKAWSK